MDFVGPERNLKDFGSRYVVYVCPTASESIDSLNLLG
jgi:hypothetical protein